MLTAPVAVLMVSESFSFWLTSFQERRTSPAWPWRTLTRPGLDFFGGLWDIVIRRTERTTGKVTRLSFSRRTQYEELAALPLGLRRAARRAGKGTGLLRLGGGQYEELPVLTGGLFLHLLQALLVNEVPMHDLDVVLVLIDFKVALRARFVLQYRHLKKIFSSVRG